MARRSLLEKRLRAILDRQRNHRSSGWFESTLCVLLVAGVGWPVAVIRGQAAVDETTVDVSADLSASGETTEPLRLGFVGNSADGKRSLGGSGHAVRFVRPKDHSNIVAVEIFASRYGHEKPPAEDFHVYLLDSHQQLILAVPFDSFDNRARKRTLVHSQNSATSRAGRVLCGSSVQSPSHQGYLFRGLKRCRARRIPTAAGPPPDMNR